MHMTLFDSRYFGPRQPAWHHLAQVAPQSIGAVDAFRQAGPYDVILSPSSAPDRWDIRRKPTVADRRWITFDTVDQDYVLVPPDEITEIWDLKVQRHVETLGAVRRGRCLFITTKLPSFSVRGDAVDSYLILAHWMDASGTTEIFVAPVRVVCQNTLLMAHRRARHHIKLVQGADSRERLREHLGSIVGRGEREAQRMATVFERLADREASPSDISAVLEAAYPSNTAARRAAQDLFNGEGAGMQVAAANGTLWGLYNAVAELENFRDDDTLKGAAYSVLFGARGATIQRAFSAASCELRPHLRIRQRTASSPSPVEVVQGRRPRQIVHPGSALT
jgi:hypothetical protein